jgi:hypothetical protein
MATREFSVAGGEEEASLAASTWVALLRKILAQPPLPSPFLLLHLPHASSRLFKPLSLTTQSLSSKYIHLRLLEPFH